MAKPHLTISVQLQKNEGRKIKQVLSRGGYQFVCGVRGRAGKQNVSKRINR
jgi:hypothetical protein